MRLISWWYQDDFRIPFAVFLLAALALLFTLRLVHLREQEALQMQTRFATERRTLQLKQFFDIRFALVRQLASAWHESEVTTPEEFSRMANSLKSAVNGILAVNWIDQQGVIRWVNPEAANAAARNRALRDNSIAWEAFSLARETGQPHMTRPINLFQGMPGVACYIPIDGPDSKLGYLNLVFTTADIFQYGVDGGTFDQDLYVSRLYDGEDEVPGPALSPADTTIRASTPVEVLDRRWTLVSMPSQKLTRSSRTYFNEGLTLLGLLFAAALAYMLRHIIRQGVALRESHSLLELHEGRYRDLYESAPLAYVTLDKSGVVRLANHQAIELFGRAQAMIEGYPFFPFFRDSPERRLAEAALEPTELGRPANPEDTYELCMDRPDGATVWVSLTIAPIESEAGLKGRSRFRAMLVDITERKCAQERQRESERRLRDLFDASLDAIFVADRDGNILDVNDAGTTLCDATAAALVGKNFTDLVARRDKVAAATTLEKCQTLVAGRETTLIETEILHPDRKATPVEMRATRIDLNGDGATLIQVRDITQRRQAQEELFRRAYYDALTGLPNRTLMLDRLEMCTRRAATNSDYGFALLFLDLDGFKNINDSLGHRAGDEMLRVVADRLRQSVGESDLVGRLAGDEFLILLPSATTEAAIAVAARIHRELQATILVGDQEVYTAASIGIALSDTRYTVYPENILRDADVAMYRAKELGRNRHVVFDETMRHAVVERLELERDLRHALERSELVLHFQPMWQLRSDRDGQESAVHADRIVAFESMLRWNHPTRGLLTPTIFMPIAEETGLIVPFGRWVIREACAQLRRWRSDAPEYNHLYVTVNLSRRELMQQDLDSYIRQVLQEFDLNADDLRVEIAENAMTDSRRKSELGAKELQQLPVKICLDRFGTGYSSLSDLRTLPIHALKIHRSFLGQAADDPRNPAIVEAIVQLAENLGLQVIIEGIEEEWQMQQLRAMSCDFAQGFYFAQPVDSESVLTMLLAAT